MDDLTKVVEDIKTKLSSLKYTDPNKEVIKIKINNEIFKNLDGLLNENKPCEERENDLSEVTYKRSDKPPIIPVRYRLLKERNK